MDYNALLPIIFYLCACFYSFFGIYTLTTNAKSRTNWQFFFLMISLTIWSFTYAMAYSVDSAETRIMWKSLGVFGWSLFYAFFLRFAIILTKEINQVKALLTSFILFTCTNNNNLIWC